MIFGLDTTLLVEMEVAAHPGHAVARELVASTLAEGHSFALAPQVLAEFIHVVSDARRFERPLDVGRARERAQSWWTATEVTPTFPDEHTVHCFLRWLQEHRLGRKRLLDTLLAATYFTSGVRAMLTTNARDFAVFGCFEIRQPSS